MLRYGKLGLVTVGYIARWGKKIVRSVSAYRVVFRAELVSQIGLPIIGPMEKPNIAKRNVRSKSQAGTGAPEAAPCRH